MSNPSSSFSKSLSEHRETKQSLSIHLMSGEEITLELPQTSAASLTVATIKEKIEEIDREAFPVQQQRLFLEKEELTDATRALASHTSPLSSPLIHLVMTSCPPEPMEFYFDLVRTHHNSERQGEQEREEWERFRNPREISCYGIPVQSNDSLGDVLRKLGSVMQEAHRNMANTITWNNKSLWLTNLGDFWKCKYPLSLGKDDWNPRCLVICV